jgi:hypothetical protein
MRKYLLVVAIVLTVVCIPRPASAHVLIQDDTHSVGAVLHITPDDDPIAGQPAQLFYDVKNELFQSNVFRPTLQIADATGKHEDVKITHSGTTVNATYTFPAQGVYDLKLTLSSPDKTYVFTLAQRVSRGTPAVVATANPDYAWADTALIASICGGIALGVVGFNHRRQIRANRNL